MCSGRLSYCTFKENLRVLDLVFEYLEIDPEKKEKMVDLIRLKSAEQSGICLAELFQQENILPGEDLGQLELFDAHLLTMSEDRLFGEIVSANGLASAKKVADAFSQQQIYFEKYRISQSLGDILVENHSLKPSARAAVLLTQDRVDDDAQLMAAFNEIGATSAENEAVNKRFCVFAIKKGLVSIEAVNAALELRRQELENGGSARFAGEILQETAGLTEEDLQSVLCELKQFEKRRLDLEKALYNEKTEIKVSKKLNRMFKTHLSKDGVTADVFKIVQKEKTQPVPVYEFLIWLRRSGIQFGIVSDDVIENFLQEAEKNTSITAARGIPPEPCVDEVLCLHFGDHPDPARAEETGSETENEDPVEAAAGTREPDKAAGAASEIAPEPAAASEVREPEGPSEVQVDDPAEDQPEGNAGDASASLRAPEAALEQDAEHAQPDNNQPDGGPPDLPQLVSPGTLLAEILPGSPGKPGRDVMGRLIQPEKPAKCLLNAGAGTARKGMRYYALVRGMPVLKNDTTLLIETPEEKSAVQHLSSPVTTDLQAQHENDDIRLDADITPGGVLKSRSLLLRGNLLGQVVCTGDVEIRGDVGTEKRISEDEIVQARILCHGNVRVSKSIRNAVIEADGMLQAFHASVYGTRIVAFSGIEVKNVLAGETGPSVLRFGLKPKDKMHALDHTIEKKKEQLKELNREGEIAELTAQYEKDLEAERKHRQSQEILKNLVEIIDAPELYQHETLLDKIEYLKQLPEYSSIKRDYLRLPEKGAGAVFFDQVMKETRKMSLSEKQAYFRKKIDPDPDPETEEATADPEAYPAQIQFDSRRALIEQEILASAGEIEKIEAAMKELFRLRGKMAEIHFESLKDSGSQVKIKNKCEKGTVIQGRIAQYVVEKDIYNVRFKEVMAPEGTGAQMIHLPY